MLTLTMLEENACLVRASSDSENSGTVSSFGAITRSMAYTEERLNDGGGEPTATLSASIPVENINHIDSNENGDLIDYNESSVLAQFHEDALRQAGCGGPQLRVLLSAGLAVMSSSVELAAIPLVLPSAQLELCIQPHERNWLLWICLLGRSVGAVCCSWSRRRGLVSCLWIHGLFSVVAAFMPTYGTAVMARFCSAIGSGGIIPISFSYLAEMCPRAHRNKALAPLLLFMGAGVLYASLVASAVVPNVKEQMTDDSKEHFSGWHRYLLLCTIPVLAALVSLLWSDESPRYLLETGREVDAMVLYQSIHRSNQSKVCGVRCNVGESGSEYRLSELQLPGKRPGSHLQLHHSVKMIYRTFFQIFSRKYRASTFLLTCTVATCISTHLYLSTFVPATVQHMRDLDFDANKQMIANGTYVEQYYNGTIENVEYANTSFTNCTFRDMTLSHVTFVNCTFVNVTFSNVRTTYAYFHTAVIVNSSIIDSDLEYGVEIDSSSLIQGGVVRGVRGACPRYMSINSIHPVHRDVSTVLIVLAYAGAAVGAVGKAHTYPATLSTLCLLLSPSLYVAWSETALYVVEALYTLLLTLLFYGVSVNIVETYPAGLRCTTHGVAMSVAWLFALIFGGIGANGGAITAAISCGILSALSIALSTALSPTDSHVL